jgi:hypothetical protein
MSKDVMEEGAEEDCNSFALRSSDFQEFLPRKRDQVSQLCFAYEIKEIKKKLCRMYSRDNKTLLSFSPVRYVGIDIGSRLQSESLNEFNEHPD